MSYNILAQTSIRRSHFPSSSDQALKWNYRKGILLKEIADSKADIICLQECDSSNYKKTFSVELWKLGYASRFKMKTSEGAKKNDNNSYGVAVFYKKSKLEEVYYEELEYDDLAKGLEGVHYEEMKRSNVGQIVALKCIGSSTGVLVGNHHLFWHLKYTWVRIKQCHMMLDHLISANKPLNFHTLVVGDFNSSPDTIIYSYLTKQELIEHKILSFLLPEDHNDPDSNHLMKVVSDSMQDGFFAKSYSERNLQSEDGQKRMKDLELLMEDSKKFPLLKSAYSNYTQLTGSKPSEYWTGEPAYTNYTVWKGTLDYIFIFPIRNNSNNQIKDIFVRSILEIPSEEVLGVGLPNDTFSSDHLSIVCNLELYE